MSEKKITITYLSEKKITITYLSEKKITITYLSYLSEKKITIPYLSEKKITQLSLKLEMPCWSDISAEDLSLKLCRVPPTYRV